ncbi:MAG: ATP-binding cassette domain-containing protein, partial [Candidatus Korobacteraceae bacterium]
MFSVISVSLCPRGEQIRSSILQYHLGMDIAIQCRDLRKTYDGKVEAVRGLDLTIGTGECFGLLGPNGAGKTTTIE